MIILINWEIFFTILLNDIFIFSILNQSLNKKAKSYPKVFVL